MLTVVRDNLINREGYTPYCGNTKCPIIPRTRFNGEQFECNCCGWSSRFPKEFINQYKQKWSIE